MPEKQKQPDLSSFARRLADRIRAEGPITVEDFMAAAGGHYYATQNAIGTEGDFTTAPEISQMFGEMIGAWLVDIWLHMGRPEQVNLVELGPGRGTLAADILRVAGTWPDFKSALSLHLVETSPRLRQTQAETLKNYSPVWYDRLEDVPAGPVFIVANEFFDALPVQQFVRVQEKWQERRIGFDEGKGFVFVSDEGDILEKSPASLSALAEMTRRIAADGGAALVIDYGHDKPGFGDTLQAVSKHRHAPALDNPGAQDITAHVDFSALRDAAQKSVRVHGPVTQGTFLKNMGIAERAQTLKAKANDQQRKDIDTALERLVSPSSMGRLFKVLGLTPLQGNMNPAGFDETYHNKT